MVDHTKPQTLNPIPVGTRVMVIHTGFWNTHCQGATGVVVQPYELRSFHMGDSIWCYGVTLDHITPPFGRPCWQGAHGTIVPIAPPDEVVIDEQIEVTA